MKDPSRGDAGMVLLNVLIIIALTAAVAAVMIYAREETTSRTLKFSEASQALALARGGERSVAAALRRDSQIAPNTDYWAERWVKTVSQPETAIEGGSFALEVFDGQARFNINNLASGASGQIAIWNAIARHSGLDQAVADKARQFVIDHKRLDDLGQLTTLGLPPQAIGRLLELATVLPAGATAINLNTAPEPLLRLLLPASGPAQRLPEIRRRNGFLTPGDLQAAGVAAPPETGFTTQYVEVFTRVRIGETRQRLESLLLRRDGGATVVRRRRAS